ncbi:phosphate ABC transporter substrate-binding protein [Saccharospirillum sp. MSK14-1]|uniref:substrate-binding domain-containing protein n=1 Tax=Saccharospirillum sp. MSK14-1 TaxID=1897632 RepID=UPI000D47FAC5|nr:substrate-binding domain-containing protein [Saccharospirillum sp. MSK14-1]PTY35688.1 phosphate ABC transporter substrate-binding protein [Saccharospirillum sp. MSK14-1]
MKKTMIGATLVAAMAASLSGTAFAEARDQISIVGSSTVYPFATVVAERFGQTTSYPTPTIESTGSGGGLRLFCQGVGESTPDITNASRRIKASELETCAANGVEDVVEVLIGFDGIAVAQSVDATGMDLTKGELFLALAETVPNPNGNGLVENPYETWSDIRGNLPNTAIRVFGPPPTSGTRDAFVELVMEEGCGEFDAIASLEDSDEDKFEEVCATMREDGAFIEAGENDTLIVSRLENDPTALGIFGFSFLDQNSDRVKSISVEGHQATFEEIASGSYPVSRPLFFYVKKAHVGVIPGMEEYLAEFTSRRAIGSNGYLVDRGLIPLDNAEYARMKSDVDNLEPLKEL